MEEGTPSIQRAMREAEIGGADVDVPTGSDAAEIAAAEIEAAEKNLNSLQALKSDLARDLEKSAAVLDLSARVAAAEVRQREKKQSRKEAARLSRAAHILEKERANVHTRNLIQALRARNRASRASRLEEKRQLLDVHEKILVASLKKYSRPSKPPRPVTQQQKTSLAIRTRLDRQRVSAERRKKKQAHAKWKQTHREFTTTNRLINKKKKEFQKTALKKWRQQNPTAARLSSKQEIKNRKDEGKPQGSTSVKLDLKQKTGPQVYDEARADTDVFYAVSVGAPLHVLKSFPIPELTKRNGLFETLAHIAAERGHAAVLNFLIKQTSSTMSESKGSGDETTGILESRDADGARPLHNACRANSTQCVHLLLEAGCDRSSVDLDGRTALHICANRGYLRLSRMLIGPRAIRASNDHDTQAQSEDAHLKDGMFYTEKLAQMFWARDKRGRRPIDEAIRCQGRNAPVTQLLLAEMRRANTMRFEREFASEELEESMKTQLFKKDKRRKRRVGKQKTVIRNYEDEESLRHRAEAAEQLRNDENMAVDMADQMLSMFHTWSRQRAARNQRYTPND